MRVFVISNPKHMKYKPHFRITYQKIGAIIAVSVILFVFGKNSYNFSPYDGGYSLSNSDELPPIDPIIADTIAHNKYIFKKDSISRIRKMRNGNSGGGVYLLNIGLSEMYRCDTCVDLHSFYDSHAQKEYMFSLTNWKLDTGSFDRPVRYFVKDGQSYLRKTIEKERTSKKKSNYTAVFEKDVPLPFRIDMQKKNIMIPISKATYQVLSVIFTGLLALLVIYFVLFIFRGFVQFLVEISKGDPFSDKNIKLLRFLMLNAFFVPFGAFVLNLIFALIFNKYFTGDFKLASDSWDNLVRPCFLYLTFSALYNAFKKGKALKEENDLTV